jgi:ATP-binding cassette subfamily B protein RaxB
MTDAHYQYGAADAAIRSTGDVVETIGGAIIVFVTARAAMGGAFTIGMMMSFIAYQAYFGRTAKNAVDALVSWRTLSVHLDRIADLALASPEVAEAGERPVLTGKINVSQVSFRYHPNESPILSDLSLSIEGGEMIAVTGRSGEGKTTLLKLLLGLEKPLSGHILYDSVELGAIARSHFVRNVATVMQDDTLLSGTIAENIAFFDSNMDFVLMENCAKLACIHEDIQAMPMRYASLIGDMGSALSGGQKQRIMIARALYRSPKILFMDEGTSHLDVHLEKDINDNLSNLNITRIVIAHRPDTLRIADRVFRLGNGTLDEISAKLRDAWT